ncbi:hypothetical protein GCM10023317_85620 [Actinopolymorpha pittospori]|uniref:Uncharacterized protein n=1 Tax=Actinopolymorpha pittospori TaxID=648752 RepID=A0A927RD83_9ACTN|nr:hypothetical protein [Actinopolymorpha pittospori]
MRRSGSERPRYAASVFVELEPLEEVEEVEELEELDELELSLLVLEPLSELSDLLVDAFSVVPELLLPLEEPPVEALRLSLR